MKEEVDDSAKAPETSASEDVKAEVGEIKVCKLLRLDLNISQKLINSIERPVEYACVLFTFPSSLFAGSIRG